MAEGRSNVAIAQRLFITEKAVSKHAAGIFAKLNLPPSDDDNRRVRRPVIDTSSPRLIMGRRSSANQDS